MEYTCIGDAVNFASRTESLNKPLHTDILITEDTYNLVKDKVLVEEMPTVTVKGKEKPQHMYAVINIPDETEIPGAGLKGPHTLAQVRSIIGTQPPDLSSVNLDEDEKKYKIQSKQYFLHHMPFSRIHFHMEILCGADSVAYEGWRISGCRNNTEAADCAEKVY